jgi:ABC-type lipoprotein export system ATPase subunit
MSDPLLRATDVTIGYGRTVIVRDASVELRPGDEIALLGRSGAGKTTLLLGLAGLLPVATGSVTYIDTCDRLDLVAMVFQAPSLVPELSARENVALPLRLRRVSAELAYQRADAALRELGVAAVDAMPDQLSGGQQQRVAVARVIATGHRVVLADEPTGPLDHATGRLVLDALRRHVADVDGALVVASHDVGLVETFRTQWTMSDGALNPRVHA